MYVCMYIYIYIYIYIHIILGGLHAPLAALRRRPIGGTPPHEVQGAGKHIKQDITIETEQITNMIVKTTYRTTQ